MKILGLLFLTLIAFSSSHEVALKVTPIDFVKCVFFFLTLLKDINRVIELVKEGDYMKLVLELIEMFPKAYEEVNKCLNPEVVLYASQKLKCNMENRTFYTCTWYSKDSCCNLYKLFSQHNCPLKPNLRNSNEKKKKKKKEHPFLYDGESTSQQQVYVDLNNAFNRFFKGISDYPKFKSKKTF